MGNWAIVITGHGANHNNDPKIDADLIAREFASRLRDAAQQITSAQFLYGVPEDLMPVEEPVEGGE